MYYYTSKQHKELLEKAEFDAWVKTLESDNVFQKKSSAVDRSEFPVFKTFGKISDKTLDNKKNCDTINSVVKKVI